MTWQQIVDVLSAFKAEFLAAFASYARVDDELGNFDGIVAIRRNAPADQSVVVDERTADEMLILGLHFLDKQLHDELVAEKTLALVTSARNAVDRRGILNRCLQILFEASFAEGVFASIHH